ncbi:MAG: AMP-binding protein [Acidobacteriia bacterium]|nr:AMP-binding protein [Terriglobia bacterium]
MNVLYCLRRAKEFHGNAVAAYRDDGSLTWNEFYERVHRAAAFLRDLGIQKGDRVAVWMLNSYEYLELYYATALAGIVIVPLNTRWHESDVAFTLTDSESAALVVDDRFAPMVASVPRPKHVIYAGAGACPEGMTAYGYSDAKHKFEEPDLEDLVGLFYTSGTTGGPKGVMLTHRNLFANLVHSMLMRFSKAIWLHAAPMFHLADLGSMYIITANGGSHAFMPSYDPEKFMQLVERYRVSETVLVPTMLNMLVNHEKFGQYDLSSLENFLYGASPMPLPLLKSAMGKLPATRFR